VSRTKFDVVVLGLGNWGTALAHHLARKGLAVGGWGREPEIAVGINKDHHNPLFCKEFQLHPGLFASDDIQIAGASQVVLAAFPSAGLSTILPQLKLQPGATVVSAIKGLELESTKTPLQFMDDVFHGSHPLAVLSGPSFARDVISGKPCGVVAASRDQATAQRVADLFASEYMRVYTSTDPVGVEFGGVLKNVIAIAVGACDALGLGESACAGLITRGLAEMTRLAVKLGADERTLAGLSGLGDLAMTSTSNQSRNRQVGLRLGAGQKIDQIVKELGSVAEGVRTARIVKRLAQDSGVEMPITNYVVQLIDGEATPLEIMRSMLSRPTKPEF
jgi:glycerol-3-phosphate dehydrogenase (NAD(P)+)